MPLKEKQDWGGGKPQTEKFNLLSPNKGVNDNGLNLIKLQDFENSYTTRRNVHWLKTHSLDQGYTSWTLALPDVEHSII